MVTLELLCPAMLFLQFENACTYILFPDWFKHDVSLS